MVNPAYPGPAGPDLRKLCNSRSSCRLLYLSANYVLCPINFRDEFTYFDLIYDNVTPCGMHTAYTRGCQLD